MRLEEIARLAGVSKSTVSRVINNEDRVSTATRAKVQAIIDAKGYRPNRAARALARSRAQTIGVVISNSSGNFFNTSNYFSTILRGISQVTTQRDYATLLMLGNDSGDDLRFARRIVHSHTMDGIILLSPSIGHPLIDIMLDAQVPFVSADRIEHEDPNVNFITVENVEASRVAVNHLIGLGRRRILMIAGEPEIIDSLDRIEGYKLALADAGIAYDPELVMIEYFEYDAGYSAIERVLASGLEFDGVYASQELIAMGAVNALLAAGVRVPEDVSLIAFDDLMEGINTPLPISTMRQYVLQKGQQLAQALLDLIEGDIQPPIQRFLSAELVVRETCGGLESNLGDR